MKCGEIVLLQTVLAERESEREKYKEPLLVGQLLLIGQEQMNGVGSVKQ